MLQTTIQTESWQVATPWLPQLARLAGATDLSLFWEGLHQLLAEVVPHQTAFMWCDYFDFGSSSKSAIVFEAPHHDRTPDYWEGRRKYHLTSGFLHSHVGLHLYRMSDVVSADKMHELEFYQRFMKPEGWEHAVTLAFWQKQEVRATVVLYRTQEQGEVSDEECSVLEVLHPIIEAALFRLIDQQRRQSLQSRVEEFVRALPIGLILLNWELQPVFINEEGYKQAFFWIHGPVRSWTLHHRKDFRVPADLRRICEDYRRVWLENHVPGQPDPDVHIERVAHPDHGELYAMVSTQAERSVSAHRPSFLIRFGGLGSRTFEAFSPSEDQLKILTQLTPAEREVAILVTQGLSNRAISDRLHRERCTVKDHLSHVYSKLGIKNRTQLAAILSR